ncbi:Permease of the major facilitator superfamily [Vibrio mimicus VM603]|uniref:Permease of the major facilitator superfamily n=2 Tax=Vibrio mimicus TaxID=674 RepID=D2YCH3_VIBMI|nr:Permease of the major facilitator superfamily [Vibrio mimicus VM603]
MEHGMSLLSVPFVNTGSDTALHIVAGLVLVASVAAGVYGFWKLHEIPINKAHSKDHHQIGLITALTWIGFLWHWVWVVAVILAFVDMDKAILHLRETWRHGSLEEAQDETASESPTKEHSA